MFLCEKVKSFDIQSNIRAQLDCLCNMRWRDDGTLPKVGDCSSHLDNTVMRTRREMNAMECRLKQTLCRLLKLTIFFYHAVIHLCITKKSVPYQSIPLNFTRRNHALSNGFRGFRLTRSMKIRIGHTRHTDMKIDTVKQRS